MASDPPGQAPFDVARFRRWSRRVQVAGRTVCRVDYHPTRMPDVGGRPVVMVANHRSLADVFVAVDALGRFDVPTRCLVRTGYFERPGMGHWLRRIGCIPAGDGKRGSVDVALETLAAGHPVAIMVEGRITPPEDRDELGLGPFRPGFVEIARAAGAVVLPIAIHGSDEVWGSRSNLPRVPWKGRPTVSVRVMEPIVIDHLDDDEAVAVTRKVIGNELVALAGASRRPTPGP